MLGANPTITYMWDGISQYEKQTRSLSVTFDPRAVVEAHGWAGSARDG